MLAAQPIHGHPRDLHLPRALGDVVAGLPQRLQQHITFGLAAGIFLWHTADVAAATTFYIPLFKAVALPLARPALAAGAATVPRMAEAARVAAESFLKEGIGSELPFG